MSFMRTQLKKSKGAFQAFAKAREGVLPVIFALAVIPAMGLVGLAVDFAGARSEKVRLQSAADAAALEAVTLTERRETDLGNEEDFVQTSTSYEPIQRAKNLFEALAGASPNVQGLSSTLEVERKGNKFSARMTYSAEYKATMPGVLKASVMPIDGRSDAGMSITGSGFMEVHALLDTSSSMGIGASQADIDALEAWKEGPNYDKSKKKGCAFSCHGEKPAGVQLRVDVMRAAVLDMIASAKTELSKQPTGEKARIKIGLSRFDHNTFEISPLSTDYDKLADYAGQIKLQNYHAGTNGKKALEWLTPKVPSSGSGHSEAAPKRFVFLVTDGLQDRHPNWYPINFSGPFGANDRIGALDATACAALKAKGVTVGVLYTTHIGIKGYEWYWKKPQPHVKPALQACASPNFFFEASDAASLSNEFKKMFKKAVLATSARLEK